MISDVCNLRGKISASLLTIYISPVGQVQCKSLLPDPKCDCPVRLGNLIVASWYSRNTLLNVFIGLPGEKLIHTANIYLSCAECVISAGLLWWISLVKLQKNQQVWKKVKFEI